MMQGKREGGSRVKCCLPSRPLEINVSVFSGEKRLTVRSDGLQLLYRCIKCTKGYVGVTSLPAEYTYCALKRLVCKYVRLSKHYFFVLKGIIVMGTR
jgi:hypothetical protein